MLSRIDYMIDEHSDQLKMVEFNLHSVGVVDNSPLYDFLNGLNLKQSDNFLQVAKILGKAVDKYEQIYKTNSQTTILLVIFENDTDILCYRHIEIQLWKLGYSVKMRSIEQLGKLVMFDEDRLLVEGSEISLVYFRTLPDERNFNVDNFESVIQPIELSRAIKLPDIGQVLISYKTFQQYFTQNEHVFEHFNDPTSCRQMREVLMDFYKIDDLKLVDEAIANPQNYVLKLSYGEAGAGCWFDVDLKLKLEEWKSNWDDSSNERCNFLLMKKINPPSFENVQVTNGYKWQRGQFNSEYGFYGALISVDDDIVFNDFIGNIVKGKAVGNNDACLHANGRLSSLIIDDDNDDDL